MRVLAIVFGVMLSACVAHAHSVEEVTSAVSTCDAPRAHCFGLQLHITANADGLVASAEWVAAEVAMANKHFAALDVGFQLAGVDTLPASAVHIENRKQRDGLATDRMCCRTIHVFVVGQLDNLDASGMIFGVTWHKSGDDHKYLIVSADAWDHTLAHELGHFFGLQHSTYPISIMNKADRAEPPLEDRTFAEEEIAAMRPILERYLREGWIVEVSTARR
jgi:hypothetical protein